MNQVHRLREGRSVAVLDGVRGLAIALVMFHNLRVDWTRQAEELPLHLMGFVGWIGVDLFFVLSGLLITSILLRTKGADGYFSSFYARRALRIVPLYVLALVVLALAPQVFAVSAKVVGSCRDGQPWDWLYLSNLRLALAGKFNLCGTNHLWSLSVEEQFYLLWPLVVFAVPRAQLGRAILAGIVAAAGSRFWFSLVGAAPVSLYVLTPTRMDGLLMGAWLALRIQEGRLGAAERRAALWTLGAVPAVLLPVFAWSVSELGAYSVSNLGSTMQRAGYFGLAAFWAAAIVVLLTGSDGVGRRCFESRLLRFLGKHSYPLYILHPLAKRGLWPWLVGLGLEGAAHQLAVLAIPGAVSVVGAVLLWHLWEQPFLRLRSAFPYGGAPAGPAVAGAGRTSWKE